MTEPITLTIERLAFGGDGVGHLSSGKVVFVSGAFPGDTVHVSLTEEHNRFARARVVDWVERAPERIEPACPVADRCGGCSFWRLDPTRAWTLKAESARDTIARLSRMPHPSAVDTIAAPQTSRYRRRLRLHFDGNRVGLFAAGSHTLVPLDDCLVAHPTLIAAAHQLQPHLDSFGRGELTLDLDDVDPPRAVATLSLQASEVRGLGRLRAALETAPHLKGVRVLPSGLHPGERGESRVGDISFTLASGGHLHRLEAGVFTQANDAVNGLLLDRVRTELDVEDGDSILELFCGWGNVSFGLVEAGAVVQGFDVAPLSLKLGLANARRLLGSAAERLTLAERDLGRGLPRKHTRAGRYRKVVLDPPRSGAAAVISGLLTLAPERIVYMSCDPATLGRDMKALHAGGYRWTRLALLDMFPQTAHVEAIATMERV